MTESALPTQRSVEFSERINLASYFWLSLKTGALTLITLGVYAPWGFVRIQRQIANDVLINGTPLSYSGRGLHLFLGYWLFIIVAFAPLVIAVTAMTSAVRNYIGFGAAFIMFPALLAWMLAFYFLMGAGIFVFSRYQSSRTQWDSALFQLGGSPWGSGGRFLGFVWASALSLYWYAPEGYRRLSAYLTTHQKLGGRSFSFEMERAHGEKVYPAFAVGWIAYVAVNVLEIPLILGPGAVFLMEHPSIRTGLTLFNAVVSTLAFAPFYAAMMRSVAAGVRFGDAKFQIEVRARDVVLLTVISLALIICTLGLMLPLVMAIWARFMFIRLSADGDAQLDRLERSTESPPQVSLAELLRSA